MKESPGAQSTHRSCQLVRVHMGTGMWAQYPCMYSRQIDNLAGQEAMLTPTGQAKYEVHSDSVYK